MLTLEKKAFDLSISQENSEGVNSRQMIKVFAMCLLSFMFLTSMYYYLGLFQSPQNDQMEELTSVDLSGGNPIPAVDVVATNAGGVDDSGTAAAADTTKPSLEVDSIKQENVPGVVSNGPAAAESDLEHGSVPNGGADDGSTKGGADGGNSPVR
mmetsp:Transcript_2817/g.3785  ORF Transcript_2817/g.3785 Transcript_2817/m.3785 type:complete len:154 (-) Transcript_2817:120-581(-)